VIAFGRQNCLSVKWTATHVNKRNFFKAPTSNVEDAGTIIAQLAVAGAETATRCHTWMIPAPAPVSNESARQGIYLMTNEKVWGRCSNCYGTGKIAGMLRPKRCPACEGTGYVQNSVWVIDIPETNSRAKKPILRRRRLKPKEPAKRG